MSQLTLTGDKIDLTVSNPEKDLSPVELKIYNYLLRMGPKSEVEIRRNPAFDDIADIGRALRRMRARSPPYVGALPHRDGPQKWLVLRWPARRIK